MKCEMDKFFGSVVAACVQLAPDSGTKPLHSSPTTIGPSILWAAPIQHNVEKATELEAENKLPALDVPSQSEAATAARAGPPCADAGLTCLTECSRSEVIAEIEAVGASTPFNPTIVDVDHVFTCANTIQPEQRQEVTLVAPHRTDVPAAVLSGDGVTEAAGCELASVHADSVKAQAQQMLAPDPTIETYKAQITKDDDASSDLESAQEKDFEAAVGSAEPAAYVAAQMDEVTALMACKQQDGVESCPEQFGAQDPIEQAHEEVSAVVMPSVTSLEAMHTDETAPVDCNTNDAPRSCTNQLNGAIQQERSSTQEPGKAEESVEREHFALEGETVEATNREKEANASQQTSISEPRSHPAETADDSGGISDVHTSPSTIVDVGAPFTNVRRACFPGQDSESARECACHCVAAPQGSQDTCEDIHEATKPQGEIGECNLVMHKSNEVCSVSDKMQSDNVGSTNCETLCVKLERSQECTGMAHYGPKQREDNILLCYLNTPAEEPAHSLKCGDLAAQPLAALTQSTADILRRLSCESPLHTRSNVTEVAIITPEHHVAVVADVGIVATAPAEEHGTPADVLCVPFASESQIGSDSDATQATQPEAAAGGIASASPSSITVKETRPGFVQHPATTSVVEQSCEPPPQVVSKPTVHLVGVDSHDQSTQALAAPIAFSGQKRKRQLLFSAAQEFEVLDTGDDKQATHLRAHNDTATAADLRWLARSARLQRLAANLSKVTSYIPSGRKHRNLRLTPEPSMLAKPTRCTWREEVTEERPDELE